MRDAGRIHFFKGLSPSERFARIIFVVIILVVLLIASVCFINAIKWLGKPFGGFLLNQRMVVTVEGQQHWTGIVAGLKYPDKILKANNEDVSSIRALEEIISGARIGDSISYAIERNGQRFQVAIPSMRFTLGDLFMTFGIYFFQGILYLAIGVAVLVLKPDSKTSWIFSSACLILSVASFAEFDTASTHFGFIRVIFFCDTFLPAFILHLSLLFPEKSNLVNKRPGLIIIPYILSASLFLALLMSYPRALSLRINKLVMVFLIISVVFFIASILHSYFRQTSILAKQRARVVFWGALIAMPVPAIAVLAATLGVSLGGMTVLNNYSSIPIVIFPATIAYAIAKHNLFDVDVYIKRTVGYVMMTFIVGSTYFSMQLLLRNFILTPLFGDYAEKVYPVLFAIMVVFFFNPLNRLVQEKVDWLFYRKKFDYKDTVLTVSNALTSILNLDEVIKRIILTVRKEMFIDTAGVILMGQQKECRSLFIIDASDDPSGHVIVEPCIKQDFPLLELVSREKKLITEYDVTEDPSYADVKESCGRRFSELGASIAVPLIYQNEVKGILTLGHKKSGHFYSREDIDLLTTLAGQGAVAIENAKMAEQMKKEEVVRTNLSRYLSPQIVDNIVKENVQVNLGGDRKAVTILFSDIRNFTTITESRPPDQLIHILNEYFTEMADIIFSYQGSLDKYIGDAIVAVFGSLIPLENPPENAVKAAEAMMKKLPELNRKWTNDYRFEMAIGIGVNTGEVFLGNIGSPERMEFTVIGDTVNVASRFSGLAKPGQILVTRETLNSLSAAIRHKALPLAEVKGKTEKLEVFEILY